MKVTVHKTESVYRWYAIISKSDLEDAARRLDEFADRVLSEPGQATGSGPS
jgi:hypothetical protein